MQHAPSPPDVKAAPAPTGPAPGPQKPRPKAAPKPGPDGSLDDAPFDLGTKSTPGAGKKNVLKK